MIAMPQVHPEPIEPFTDGEMVKILQACDAYAKLPGAKMPIEAFVLLLRHSGWRIHDATTLERKNVTGGTLLVHTEKTGTQVRLRLHPDCIAALNAIPEKGHIIFGLAWA